MRKKNFIRFCNQFCDWGHLKTTCFLGAYSEFSPSSGGPLRGPPPRLPPPTTTCYETLKQAFDKLPKGESAVIVIDDSPLKAINKTIRSIIKCQHCRDLINVLVVDAALAKLGKKAVYHCLHYSSPEQSVKDFMSGLKKGEILVTSTELIRGSEHPIIIDTANTYEISSRTSSKLVKIYSNQFLDQMVIYEQLLKDDKQHQCQEMMERESRPHIDQEFQHVMRGNKYHILIFEIL